MNTHRITWTADGPEFPVLPIELLTAAPFDLVEYVRHLETAIKAMHATGCETDAVWLRVAMADLVDEWRGLSNCYAATGGAGDRAQALAYDQCSGQLGRLANASADGSAVADTVRRDVGLSEREIRTMIHHATVKAQVESDNFNGPKLGTATITDIIKDALEPLVAVILEPNNGGQP